MDAGFRTWFWQSDLQDFHFSAAGLGSLAGLGRLVPEGCLWPSKVVCLVCKKQRVTLPSSLFLNSLGNSTYSPGIPVRLMGWLFNIELPAKPFQWISGLFFLALVIYYFSLIHMFLRQEGRHPVLS